MFARAGTAIGVVEDDEFFKLGDNTAGHLSAFLSGTAFNETTSAAYSYGDCLNQYYTLPQQYRDGAIWLVNPTVLRLLANVRDGFGRPFYQGLMDAPAPISDDITAVGTILRRPVYEVPFTAGTIWFGDPRAAYIVGSLPFVVFTLVYMINPHYMGGFFTDQRLIVAGIGGIIWMSIGGMIMAKMVNFEI